MRHSCLAARFAVLALVPLFPSAACTRSSTSTNPGVEETLAALRAAPEGAPPATIMAFCDGVAALGGIVPEDQLPRCDAAKRAVNGAGAVKAATALAPTGNASPMPTDQPTGASTVPIEIACPKRSLRPPNETLCGALNAQLSASAKIERNNGKLLIDVSYKDPRWNVGRNIRDTVWFAPPQTMIMVVLDHNNNTLDTQTTNQSFMPSEIFAIYKSDTRSRIERSVSPAQELASAGTQLTFDLAQPVAQYADHVLLSFFTRQGNTEVVDPVNILRPSDMEAFHKKERDQKDKVSAACKKADGTPLPDGMYCGGTAKLPVGAPDRIYRCSHGSLTGDSSDCRNCTVENGEFPDHCG